MNRLSLSPAARKAILIGCMCSISYLAVYVARNILGAVSPQMISGGAFTTESIGTLSSVYFITYAVGQLINGSIGDKIPAKYMISFGLVLAGVGNLCFPLCADLPFAGYAAYGASGFFLSMIYGPMTKVVAENTEPIYATRCSLGYTFASFFGSPSAGILAAFLTWQSVFVTSSAMLLLMGCICFLAFTVFERRGIIVYGKYTRRRTGSASRTEGIRILLRHRIVKFTLISILTGVVRTTVVFWLPTYLAQHLGFAEDTAALLFTAATFVISMTAFVAVFLYERLGRNMDLTIRIAFISSSAGFLMVFLWKNPALNIAFLIFAIMSSNIAASMLWSRYCPSLRDTGMVSSATGFLDFMSYMAAAASSRLFASAAHTIGWSGLILVWLVLMLAGMAVSFTGCDAGRKSAPEKGASET
ncbi:MAG: MFS transporter [Clostridia bacterium]|nr:MFS transporter [Clostridia bacterium]